MVMEPSLPPAGTAHDAGSAESRFFFGFFRVFLHVEISSKIGRLKNLFFFRDFLTFLVFARRFLLDFRGLGRPPGLIFGVFLRYSFFARFFHIFSQKNEKNKKVKTAQNTAPVQRIWLSGVWKKHTQNRKNAFKFSLIFGAFLASNGRKRRKKTAKARKSLLAPSLGTPFWPQGRF